MGSTSVILISIALLLWQCGAEWINLDNTTATGVVLHSSKCTIERRKQLSVDEFERYYKRLGLPVIIEREPNANARFHEMCQQEYLLQHFSNVTVTLSSANTFSYNKKKIMLGKYIDEMVGAQDERVTGIKTYILFGDTEIDELQPLLTSYNQPQYFGTMQPSLSWGIAGSGTGVPFHRHGAVFNEVIYGYKRWFLSPPAHEPIYDSKQTTLHWLKNIYSSASFEPGPLQECVLGPNEVLYVPDEWWHATLNVGQTVNIATFV